MKLENLKRGNEIIGAIKFNNEQIEKLNNTRDYSPSEYKVSVVNHSYKIPSSIRDTIILLIENEYKKENEKLEKEFKEL